jgi:hypothetical protein
MEKCNKDEKVCLEELKEAYGLLREKHNLPEFDELNKDFSIEKISEYETTLLLKEIRRFMFDKFSNYMRFLEGLLNPVNASVFTFSVLKTLNSDNKKVVENIYKKLMKIELELMAVDIEYDEIKEVEFIKGSYGIWNEIKKEWIQIIDSVKKNWDNKIEGNSKCYFG